MHNETLIFAEYSFPMFKIIFIFAVLLLILAIVFIANSKSRGKINYSCSRKGTLLSRPEQILFYRLIEAFPNHLVFAQVSMHMIVKPTYSNRSENTILFNKISRKVFDFVICDKKSNVLCVVELDDSSHNTASGKKRDHDKNMALKSASIPLVRFHVKEMPFIDQIRQNIQI